MSLNKNPHHQPRPAQILAKSTIRIVQSLICSGSAATSSECWTYHVDSVSVRQALPLWRPAGNVDPLFANSKLKNFRKVRISNIKHYNGRRITTNKRHKHIDTSTDTQIEESEPIGAQSSTQSQFPLGKKRKLTPLPLTRIS